MKKVTRGLTNVLALFLCIICLTAVFPISVLGADKTLQDTDALYHDLSFEEELTEAEEVLDLGDLSNRTTNLVLPYSYGMHINISWKISDETVIDKKGNLVLPTDSDKDVTLTATLTSTKTETSKTKVFTVHVPKASPEDVLERDAKDTMEYVDYIINTGYVLPDKKELGIRSEISWKIVSGEAKIEKGKIVKTENSLERQPLELKATLTYQGNVKEIQMKNITLLDEYVGYILSYFAGKNESKEMYLGYSYDGINWMWLNNADAVLTPTLGDKEIRDPFIMRKKDGSFAIFCTDGWNGNELSIWDSENLTSFDNERLCIMKEEKGIGEGPSGYHTWAPECNYDPITDQYYIYWSDPKGDNQNGQTYYNTSTDLLTFSEPGLFFQREFSIIDASIKKYKGDYYMVYDDATGDNEETTGGRRIYVAKADTLEPGAFYPYSGCISEQVSEGPFLLQDFKTGSFMAYYDYYHKHKFGLTTIEDITTDNWVYQGISETMPSEEVRHGGAIAVTLKELNAIQEKWGFEPAENIPTADEDADKEDSKSQVTSTENASKDSIITPVKIIVVIGIILFVGALITGIILFKKKKSATK